MTVSLFPLRHFTTTLLIISLNSFFSRYVAADDNLLHKNEILKAQRSVFDSKGHGQKIRLRGSKGIIGAGRIEISDNGQWVVLCDKNFNINAGHAVCRSLGFERGAVDIKSDSFYGNGNSRNFYSNNLTCDGTELSVQECQQEKFKTKLACNIVDEVAGVQCKLNYASHCKPGGYLFRNKCYYFHSKTQKTFDEASDHCKQNGGSLAVIRFNEENDFLSEALFALSDNDKQKWYTSGKKVDSAWQWSTGYNLKATTFTKWKPSFTENKTDDLCMVLGRNDKLLLERDYYFWDAEPCSTKENYICEEPLLNIGCIRGNGNTYDGSSTFTYDGQTCLNWNDPKAIKNGHLFPEQSKWNHNFCRNPDNDESPWCFTNSGKPSFCDINRCQSNTASVCQDKEARCGDISYCIPKSYVCDGDQDCPNGVDEKNCSLCGKRIILNTLRHDSVDLPHKARIVGGHEAIPGSYPWTGSVRIKPDVHHCGAVVISDRYVLTAAHCFDKSQNENDYEVRVGDWDNQADDGTEKAFDIDKIIRYPDYKNVLKDDIALLRLKLKNDGGIKYTDYVQPICLPPSSAKYNAGSKCFVSGWGKTSITENPRKLQFAEIPILSRQECTNPKAYGPSLSQSAFCAGLINGGIDSCVGDSGGPFACENNGAYYLYGIVSYGDGCAERNKPGVYTKVVDYLDWIKETIEK